MSTNIPTKIIVHHTGGSAIDPLQDSSNFTFDQCNEQHRISFNLKSSLGFYIGYHYYISKDGTIKQGRLDTDEGAHTIGQNLSSLGICLAGNFDATLPTQAQIATLTTFLVQKSKQYNITSENVFPHRHFAAKTCYGNKLGDSWAADLLRKAIQVIPPVMGLTREQRISKAMALIAEAADLLKGLN